MIRPSMSLDQYLRSRFGTAVSISEHALDLTFDGRGRIEVIFDPQTAHLTRPTPSVPRLLASVTISRDTFFKAIQGDIKKSDLLMTAGAIVEFPDQSAEAVEMLKQLALEHRGYDDREIHNGPVERPTKHGQVKHATIERSHDESVEVADAIAAARAGGLGLLNAPACQRLGRGRIHDVFSVVSDGRTFVLHRVNEAVVSAQVLALTTAAILTAMGGSLRLREWPATGRAVLEVGADRWLYRDHIEGHPLSAPVNTEQVEQMASCLRDFHEAMSSCHSSDIFPPLDPWGSSIDSTAVQNSRTPWLIPGRPELVAFGLLEAARLRCQPSDRESYESVILHRDPKPSNFVRGSDGKLTLIDFDTVGIGDRVDDLGELVRAVVAQDEAPIYTPVLEPKRCSAIVQAAIRGYGDQISCHERDLSNTASEHARILAQRFLFDHLAGNVYFRETYSGENFGVARANIEAMFNLDSRFVGQAAGGRLLIYAGAPNNAQGELSAISEARLRLFSAIARRTPGARLVLTGGFGDHFNRSEMPHYEHAMRFLKSTEPGVAGRIEACLPSMHSYHDAQMAAWYADETGARSITMVTSDFHAERLEFLLRLHTRQGVGIGIESVAAHPTVPEGADALLAHDRRGLALSSLTALLVGRDNRLM